MSRIRIEREGEDGWTDWIRPVGEVYRLVCCDCGLSHDMQFDVNEDGNPIFRARRNNRSTAQVRRHGRITVRC